MLLLVGQHDGPRAVHAQMQMFFRMGLSFGVNSSVGVRGLEVWGEQCLRGTWRCGF